MVHLRHWQKLEDRKNISSVQEDLGCAAIAAESRTAAIT